MTQIIALSAVRKFTTNALALVNHQCISTPKSHISCGISCKSTAKLAAIPTGMLTKKLDAIIIPSIILCTKSHTRFIIAKE